MKNIKYYISILLLVALAWLPNTAQAQDGFVVIVNKNVDETTLSKSSIRRIYFGFTTQWKNFDRVKPSYTEVSNAAFWNYISTEKGKFKSFWTKKVFSGNGVAPDEFNDGQGVIDFVSSTDGAIGIIPSSAQNNIGDCKIVTLQ